MLQADLQSLTERNKRVTSLFYFLHVFQAAVRRYASSLVSSVGIFVRLDARKLRSQRGESGLLRSTLATTFIIGANSFYVVFLRTPDTMAGNTTMKV